MKPQLSSSDGPFLLLCCVAVQACNGCFGGQDRGLHLHGDPACGRVAGEHLPVMFKVERVRLKWNTRDGLKRENLQRFPFAVFVWLFYEQDSLLVRASGS